MMVWFIAGVVLGFNGSRWHRRRKPPEVFDVDGQVFYTGDTTPTSRREPPA